MSKTLLQHNGPTSVARPVLAWYDKHARALPWRVPPLESKAGKSPDPYRIWLSEIMLQQTTVATVRERYSRFLYLWPQLEDLAGASVEDVLAEWAGLGYYARARNLHKCARMVMAEYGGVLPNTETELLKLPGIGPYTAAAISSIAFGKSAVVVDGNIERVMARLFAIKTPLPDAKVTLKHKAATLTPAKRAGDYAQALMDLGATICTPRNPVCSLCPVKRECIAFKTGIAETLPVKKKKTEKPVRYGAFTLYVRKDGAVWLVRRPAKGLLGGMLALPSTEWSEQEAPVLAGKKLAEPIKHTFTHFHLYADVYINNQSPAGDGEWHLDVANAGLPTVFLKGVKAGLSIL